MNRADPSSVQVVAAGASHALEVTGLGKRVPLPAGELTILDDVGFTIDREQFDLLHFHEPFVPFLSLVVLGLSNSVNVATFHAYAGFSPSYEFGSRALRGYASRPHGRIAVSAAAMPTR